MKNNILKYGLISGIILVILTLSFHYIYQPDYSNPAIYEIGEIVGYTSMLVALSLIFFGIKSYKVKYNNGELSFGQGLKIGLGITFISSVLFAIFTFLLYSVFEPGLFDEMNLILIDGIEQSNLPELEKTKKIERVKMDSQTFGSPYFLSLIMFLTVFIIGSLITLISTFILKKKPITNKRNL